MSVTLKRGLSEKGAEQGPLKQRKLPTNVDLPSLPLELFSKILSFLSVPEMLRSVTCTRRLYPFRRGTVLEALRAQKESLGIITEKDALFFQQVVMHLNPQLDIRRYALRSQDLEAAVKAHPHLEYLELKGRVASLAPLRQLRNSLQRLKIEDCKNMRAEDLGVIGELPQLRELRCLRCRLLSSTDALFDILGMQILDLTDTELTIEQERPLSGLQKQTELVFLSLSGWSSIEDADLQAIRPLSQLEELDLADCSRLTSSSFEEIGRLVHLRKLNAKGIGNTSSADFVHLRRLKKLEILYLSLSEVTLKNVTELLISIPSLRKLKILAAEHSIKEGELAQLKTTYPQLTLSLVPQNCNIS